jgi:general secretion pathway protein G
MNTYRKHSGFTIVELLIVIVVIGILAAITIVAFNGVQNRAKVTAVTTDLSNTKKLLGLFEVSAGQYPASLTEVNNGQGVKASTGTTLQYTASGGDYCVTATNGAIAYKVTNTAQTPTAGGCVGHTVGGAVIVTNLMKNPSLETSNAGWAYHASITGSRTQINGKWTTTGTRTATGATAMYAGRTDLSQVTQGAAYTASALVTSSIAQDVRIEVRNNTSSTASFMNTYTLAANTPQRISTSGIAGDSTVHVTIWWQNGVVGDSVTVDEVMLTAGSTNYNYADGNSPNWAWDGTTNLSTSTGPAL